MGFRQPQQRQRPIGVAGAQGIERAVRADQRIGERLVGNAVFPDGLFQRVVDGLNHRHARTLPAVIVRASGRSHSRTALEVRPLGRPAIVTSRPPP